jgi:hypothetical protein
MAVTAAITLAVRASSRNLQITSVGFRHIFQPCGFRFAEAEFGFLASRSETEDHDGRSPPYFGR